LRVAEFLDHAIDGHLMFVAVVTDDTHPRNLPRRIPAGLS
jgi:hypothetical protein